MSTSTTVVAQTHIWNKLDLWGPKVLSAPRIVVCFVFVEHGTQKLLGLPHASFPMPAHLPPLFLAAGIIETFGGLLLLLGLLTRPVAFILCGEMAVAYFMMHEPHGFWPLKNGGEPPVCRYCIVLFFCTWCSPEEERGVSTDC